ncbi:amidohydrolase family protein [Spongiactinospora sp. TRM90649]|uniref:amidohydrolase family protein n=1 Tax=Spongiactinospora sp. TRM90649 TaxID=3031114 RepID=UPI0023F8521E|nr:amidohydrolase family protein [Spongiactinospora sp. TRM90649]MDF5757601.1 amidohydrolase family protein [Spongiactinospora sp. TRM90649]
MHDTDELRRATRQRAELGADVVKIMASGGVLTPGTGAMRPQFTAEELRAAVEEAHRAGLPITAHAHALPAVRLALEAGVDGIEHCTCLTPEGVRVDDDLLVVEGEPTKDITAVTRVQAVYLAGQGVR